MDLYWVTKAGMDPIALINKNPGRFPLWHLKDMDATPQHAFTEVGNGYIDFKRFLRTPVRRPQILFCGAGQVPGVTI